MNRSQRRARVKGSRPLYEFLHFRAGPEEGLDVVELTAAEAFSTLGDALSAFARFRAEREGLVEIHHGDEFVLFRVGVSGPKGEELYPEREIVAVATACSDPGCLDHSVPEGTSVH